MSYYDPPEWQSILQPDNPCLSTTSSTHMTQNCTKTASMIPEELTGTKKTINPLIIPEIMETFTDVLDNKTIMTSRLVCRLWNEEAVVTLRKRIDANQVTFPNIKLTYEGNDEILNAPIPTFFDDSEILDILLSNMHIQFRRSRGFRPPYGPNGPRVWSNRAAVDKYKHHFELTEDGQGESVLFKYGKYIRTISELEKEYIKYLLPLLVTICPNLEALYVQPIGLPLRAYDSLEFPENHKLNLKSIRFFFAVGSQEEFLKYLCIFKAMLLASHSLKSLRVNSIFDFDLIADLLIPVTEITRNLAKMYLYSDILNKLHLLNKIEFGQLKEVRLIHTVKDRELIYASSPGEIFAQLKQFLKSCRHSLKILNVQLSSFLTDRYRERIPVLGDGFYGERQDMELNVEDENEIFPEMPSLITLNVFFTFKSLQFLQKFPNLNELQLSGITETEHFLNQPIPQNKITDFSFTNEAWRTKISWACSEDPCQIFHIVSHADVIRNRIRGFPNLKKLYLELLPSKALNQQGRSDWFLNVSKEISLAQNLKNLKLSFWNDADYICQDSWQWHDQVDLEPGFDLLKRIPKLESIVLGNRIGIIKPREEVNIIQANALIKLAETPKLKLLKLVNFKVGGNLNLSSNEAVEEVAKFYAEAQRKNITVTSVVYTQLGDYFSRYKLFEDELEPESAILTCIDYSF